MDPDTSRAFGEVEESEPAATAPGRSVPFKKPLEQFLREFEDRLREHPEEPATSASAALAGRAEGVWRTPVEGGERPVRRLPRATGRPPAAATTEDPSPLANPPETTGPVAGAAPPTHQAAADPPAGGRRNRRQRRHRRR